MTFPVASLERCVLRVGKGRVLNQQEGLTWEVILGLHFAGCLFLYQVKALSVRGMTWWVN